MSFKKLFIALSRCIALSMGLLLNPILTTLLPSVCLLCSSKTPDGRNICAPCLHDLPILPHSCERCGKFFPSPMLIHKPATSQVCGKCLTSDLPYQKTYYLFPYETPIIYLISQLKFSHNLCCAPLFAELFMNKIDLEWYKNTPLPDLLIPIPLHFLRLRQRGYNQALEIAKPISRTLRIPLDTHIYRTKNTPPQSGLPAAARHLNLKNAFRTNKDYTGLSLAVLDDVMTTGATMQEFCQLLKDKGAKEIVIWCVARRG